MQSLDTRKWRVEGEKEKEIAQSGEGRRVMGPQTKESAASMERKGCSQAQAAYDEVPSLCSAHPALHLTSGPLAPGTADLK